MEIGERTNFFVAVMLDLNIGLYSPMLLGSCRDPSTVTRISSLLVTLGLLDNSSRSLRLTDYTDLVVLFRVAHFTSADFVVAKNFSKIQIFAYNNPCNMRVALARAVEVCREAKLFEIVSRLLEEIRVNFSGPCQKERNLPAPVQETLDANSIRSVINNFDILEGTDGFTLRANRDITGGEIAISIPLVDTISIFSAFRNPSFPGESIYRQGLHPDTIFLLFLLYLREHRERIPNEVHREFMACQPETYGTLFEWPSEAIEALDEFELRSFATVQNEDIESICRSLEPAPSFKDMLWAKCLCTSRAFSLPISPQSDVEREMIREFYPSGMITTILPGVHFLNHDFAAQLCTPEVSTSGESVVVKALSNINKGHEAFLIYGGFTNKELMLNYGFYIRGNPYDSIETEKGDIIRRGVLVEEDQVTDYDLPIRSVPAEFQNVVSGYLTDRQAFYKAAHVSK